LATNVRWPTNRILIVGDAALGRGLIRMVLTKLGYPVTTAATGRQAADLLRHSRFGLLLVAAWLPDSSGATFIRRLRQEAGSSPLPPCVMFEGAARGSDSEADLSDLDLAAHLRQPVSIAGLVATARTLLARDGMSCSSDKGRIQMHGPIDTAHLANFTDGDTQLERELASLFLSTADQLVEQLKQSLTDRYAWRDAAHTLKGASANIGAISVAELAAKAELDGPCRPLLDDIEGQLAQVQSYFSGR
jgi:DNA-binding response OmpR family regulator